MAKRSFHVAVVGAGPTGALVAERLAARGHRVVVLDAGHLPRPGERVGEVDRRLWPHCVVGRGWDWYRVRAVGGRAHLWGGWCQRFSEAGFRRADWPVAATTMARSYATVERLLGVVGGKVDPRYRTLARALGLRVLPKRGALVRGRPWTPLDWPIADRVRASSVALRVEHSLGRASAIPMLSLEDGRTRSIEAQAFVLAASPIETARLLLSSELGRRAKRIGRGLVDHMVASFVLLEPSAPQASAGRGPFPGMALLEVPVNGEPGTERRYRGGFSIELTGPVPLETLGLERLVPSDEVERWSATQIHALGELFPHARRYVDLDPERRDGMGRPVPRIHSAWSPAERQMARDMRRACIGVADALAVPGSRLTPFTDPLSPGAGHEAGTCAMGRDEDAPCDPHGRLRALDNVWIADASVMPTSGDRHPTLTVMAHALRVADAVSRHVDRVTAFRRPSSTR